ncbi:hypothetical protein KCP78_12990 [Salmonella enterica subsp. enterica]|nr:hypothetical protein KCP78_12990 [Salmonella enterica subsp. enterica]
MRSAGSSSAISCAVSVGGGDSRIISRHHCPTSIISIRGLQACATQCRTEFLRKHNFGTSVLPHDGASSLRSFSQPVAHARILLMKYGGCPRR